MTACMFTLLNVVRIAFSLLRLQQALGDAGAQAAHRHALFRTAVQRQRRGRDRSGGGLGGRGGAGGQGVAPGHAPSRPVPATAAASTPFSARILAAAGEATPAAEVEAGAAARPARQRRPGRRARRRRGRGGGGGLAGGVDAGQQLARGHGAAIALDDFSQHARSGAGTSSTTLSVSDFDEDFVRFDGRAGLLLPGQQGRFGNGFGKLGTTTSVIAI